jgi:hypothetical protein
MKNFKLLFFLTGLITLFISCGSPQSAIDKTSTMIERAEHNKDALTQSDFDNLELKMEELQKDLEVNRKNYTDQQVKEIGKLQGRYAALLVKQGINDFKESVKDLGNQMEGFMEGITDTTNNK